MGLNNRYLALAVQKLAGKDKRILIKRESL